MNKNMLEFPISIYGTVEKINDTLSKARCRIFYKGGNRNGTFITDDFAEELISTLHYVPVKGIYEQNDYTDHGDTRDEGKIYGIVPENNNFAWEQHLDSDGIERTYACTDVYLFTALYPEAIEIVGKGQSMELYEPSLQYHFAIMQGQRYVVFEHGSFLGLQVLGDNVEPCFEGASFYSLQNTIQSTIQKIKEYSIVGGKSEMDKKMNFKLSDSKKHEYLWTLLNPEYNAEGNWTCSYSICDVYDDYALVYNVEQSQYERVYYIKNDEQDSIELGDIIPVYIVDVLASEKDTLDTLRKLNGDTYELINENLVKAEENAQECVTLNHKIEEMNNIISTLHTEAENMQLHMTEIETQVSEKEEALSNLTAENEILKEYKYNMDKMQKQAVLAEYSDKLTDTILEQYESNLDNYDVQELDMHLAYELKQNNFSAFTKDTQTVLYPKKIETMTGVEEILSRYIK